MPIQSDYGVANLFANPATLAGAQDLAVQAFINECEEVLAVPFTGGVPQSPYLDQDGELLPFIDSTNLVVSLGLEEGLGQNVITQEVEQFKPPALGYFINPFEYYFGYQENSTIQPVLLNDENPSQTGRFMTVV